MPHGFCVPKQRADRSRGPWVTSEVGAGGASAVGFSTHTVGFMSVEMGLMPMDSLTSFAQSSGVGIRFVGSSSVQASLVGLSLFVSPLAWPSRVVVFAVPNVASTRRAGISAVGSAMVSGMVFRAFSLSLILTFVLRSSSMSRTSVGNGMPSSFGHLCRRRHAFSLICSSVMVTGLHQSPGGWIDLGCTEGYVGMGSWLVVGVGKSCVMIHTDSFLSSHTYSTLTHVSHAYDSLLPHLLHSDSYLSHL